MDDENSSFLYPNYLKVAKKKSAVCKYLLGKCNEETSKDVLHDIWYLSGYILEGLCNYSIFKINNWPEDVPIKDYRVGDVDDEVLGRFRAKKIGFYQKDGSIRNDYFISGHDYKHNKQLLMSTFRGTRFFGSEMVTNIEVRKLMEYWDVEFRYRYDMYSDLMNIRNIKEVLEICEELLKFILNGFSKN